MLKLDEFVIGVMLEFWICDCVVAFSTWHIHYHGIGVSLSCAPPPPLRKQSSPSMNSWMSSWYVLVRILDSEGERLLMFHRVT